MRRRDVAAAVVACAMLAGTGSLAQQQPSFRTGVETVAIYATVTDRHGALVPDLVESDFEIREDGKPQPLTVFDAGVQPITIAVLLDESPSVFDVRARIRGGFEAFVHHLLDADRAVVGTFTQTVRLDPHLSHDPAALLARLDTHDPFPAGTALWDAMDEGRRVLEPEGGRRVLLMFTDGNDNCSWVYPDDVRHAIELDGEMFYGIGVRAKDGLPLADLRDLARRSGGWLFELKPADDLAATFEHVADELHRQYVLGFAPRRLDGKTHKIEVRVHKSGMTVRARESYIAEAHR